jgi:hypothetical protein
MPRYPSKGISNLSQLGIDVSKDWLGFLLKNLGAGVDPNDAVRRVQTILQSVLTTKGDLLYRNSTEAVRLALNYGVGYNVLHALDSGVGLPEWFDIQNLIIYLTGAVNRAVAPPILQVAPPGLSLTAVEDHSGGGFAATPSLTVPAPAIAAASVLAAGLAVDGFVMHDETPTDTDQTAQANDAVANDMGLMPAALVANGDGCYFGLATPWDALNLNIGTAGAGTYTIAWKYWNGAAWSALTIKSDETNHFKTTGFKSLVFTRPGDWAVKTIAGIANLYWIYAQATEGTMTIRPLGTQAWIYQY